jgi:hypothetical protein
VPAAHFEQNGDDEPPPPPPFINHARKCADVEEAAIHQLQIALETGKMDSGVSFIHHVSKFHIFTPVESILIERPWLANAPIPPSNEPLLICASRAGNIGTFSLCFETMNPFASHMQTFAGLTSSICF